MVIEPSMLLIIGKFFCQQSIILKKLVAFHLNLYPFHLPTPFPYPAMVWHHCVWFIHLYLEFYLCMYVNLVFTIFTVCCKFLGVMALAKFLCQGIDKKNLTPNNMLRPYGRPSNIVVYFYHTISSPL